MDRTFLLLVRSRVGWFYFLTNCFAGQVASLTSTNNFINFCLTVPQLPLTNGQQITTGSCNPAPIGIIPSSSNMPSAKFTNPKNGDTIPANQALTITMAINNMATGNFVNAQQNYFAAPQQLSSQGTILGHSHVVVEALTSLSQTTPTDPTKFAFFKVCFFILGFLRAKLIFIFCRD
jgi:hypothetical protein